MKMCEWWMTRSMIGTATASSWKNSPQLVKSLLVVRMNRAVLVQAVDQLEQVVPGLSGHRQVAQLVDHQHIVFGQVVQPLFQLAFHLRQLQLFHQRQRSAE